MANETTRPIIRRKQYIVSKKFQLKYVGQILLLMFLMAAMCAYVVYYSVMLLMGEKLANVYPQGRLMAIVNTVNLRIMLSMLLISPLVAIIGIFISHKIAGPVYRIERILANMAGGDLSAHIVLRKGDELTSLADSINKVTESAKMVIISQKERMAAISNEMNVLKKSVGSGSQVPLAVMDSIRILEKEIGELAGNLNEYKLK